LDTQSLLAPLHLNSPDDDDDVTSVPENPAFSLLFVCLCHYLLAFYLTFFPIQQGEIAKGKE
jgi:hypothetical protein